MFPYMSYVSTYELREKNLFGGFGGVDKAHMKAAGPSTQNAIRAMRAPSENITMVRTTINPICCCCAVGCLPNYCKNMFQLFPRLLRLPMFYKQKMHMVWSFWFFWVFFVMLHAHSLTHFSFSQTGFRPHTSVGSSSPNSSVEMT